MRCIASYWLSSFLKGYGSYHVHHSCLVTCKDDYKGRRGAHRTNLFDVLIKDLIKRKLISNKVLKLTDFDNLVHMAHNRVVWGSMKNV